MKAIIMAAGVGSRISRVVQKPKCTLDVKDTTIIRHTIELLLANSIDATVVVGYKQKDVLDAIKGLPVESYYNPFYAVTNSMASLWFARDALDTDEDVIFMNADTYFEQPLLDRIIEDDHDYMMLGDRSRVEKGDYFFNVVDDHLEKYGKELTIDERNCEYVGFAKIKGTQTKKFKQRLCDLVEQGMYNLWWENVLYENISHAPVFVKDVSDLFWAEVDYIDDYERIQNYLNGTGWK